MTDVEDYGTVAAGPVTVLATGLANADNTGNFTLTANNVPSTVTAVLLLVLVKAVTGAGETYTIPQAFGNVTLQPWRPLQVGANWEPVGNGLTTVAVNDAMAPVYFPFNAGADTGFTVKWAATPGGGVADQVEYWLMGVADPTYRGSSYMPLLVANSVDPANGSDIALFVAPQSGVSFETTETDPSPHTAYAGSQGTAAASGGAAVLLAPPPAGKMWEVCHLQMWAGTTAVAAVNADIRTTNGNISLLIAWAAAGGFSVGSDAHFFLSDGLTLSNRTAVAASGSVLARQVTAV